MTAPILFAMEEFPQLREIIEQGFDDPSNVNMVCIENVPPLSCKMLQYPDCEIFISHTLCGIRSDHFTPVGPRIPPEKSRNREDKVTCC